MKLNKFLTKRRNRSIDRVIKKFPELSGLIEEGKL